MTNIQSQQTSGPSAPLAVGRGGRAQRRAVASIESLRMTLENNRNVMVKRLTAFDGVQVTKPGGTFYCFPDFSAYEKDSHEARRSSCSRTSGWSPCRARSSAWKGHLRLSYCGTIKDVTRGRRAHQVGARSRTRPTSSTWATASL